MKRSLRDPLTDKALDRKPLPTLPLPPNIMRQSMVAKSTAAARAAGARHMDRQVEKNLPDDPQSQPQSQPQSAPRPAPKSGSGRGKLAHGTMRKPVSFPSHATSPRAQKSRPQTTETRDHPGFTTARQLRDPSYPPSAWARFADRRQDSTYHSRAPRDAVWRPGPDPRVSVALSDHSTNRATLPETGQIGKREGTRRVEETATNEKRPHLQSDAAPISSLLKRPRTAGERIATKLSTWSRGMREKSASQDRPNTAVTQPTARRRDSAHWGPFRTAIEKMTASSRPSSQEEWLPPISRPIDHGDVFTADVVARQQKKPREYSSWLAAHLAETADVSTPVEPHDPFASMSRDTRASMESRIIQMQDFMDRHSRLEQPVPRSSLVSKLIHPRASFSRPETRHNNESSPLDFACAGEWVDPEPDYDPFKHFDKVLTPSEPDAREEALAPEVGLGIADNRGDFSTAENFSCPDCNHSGWIYNDRCTNCKWTGAGVRPRSSSCSPKQTGQVQSNTAQVVPNCVSVHSSYPEVSWKSISPASQLTPSTSHSTLTKEFYHVNVDVSSLAGAAYHQDCKLTRPASPAASSEYSIRPESMVYEDPGNPFADQHAVDAYREAMNRWHPSTSQVAPLSLGTSSFAQHREQVLQQRQQANRLDLPCRNDNPGSYPNRNVSRSKHDSLYTLAGHADDEVSDESTRWIQSREAWMTLDPSYASSSRSYGTLSDTKGSSATGDTIVSIEGKYGLDERSFAARAATMKINFGDPAPRSRNDRSWPYAPSESNYYDGQQQQIPRSRSPQESAFCREGGVPGSRCGQEGLAEAKPESRRKQIKGTSTEAIRDTAFYGFYDDVLSNSPVDEAQLRMTPNRGSRLSRPWEPDVSRLR